MITKKDHILISDLDQLKIISDPLRMRLFEDIRTANQQGDFQPIRQAAANLEINHAKLYYHIKQLEKYGFIYVADTKYVSGIAEKHYAVVADLIIVNQSLLAGDVPLPEAAATMLNVLKSAFDITIAELNQLFQSEPTGERHIHFNRLLLRLPHDKAAEYQARLAALENEMLAASAATSGPGGAIYSYTVAVVPTVRSELVGENEV